MPRKEKGNRKRKRWEFPPEFYAPSNPEEFKFCFALMGAASSGKMRVPSPKRLIIEEVGEVSFTNTPFNRGMLAVSKHYNEVHPRDPDSPVPPEFHALMTRLIALGDLLSTGAIEKKYARMEKYLNRENEAAKGYVEVAEPLVEAAATAVLGKRGGFKIDSLFSIADKLVEKYEDTEQHTGS
jgi:hypothetical protein